MKKLMLLLAAASLVVVGGAFSITSAGAKTAHAAAKAHAAAARGPRGPRGPRGFTGARGPAGANGTNGANGANGAAGSAGPAGPAGPKGDTGPAGPGSASITKLITGNNAVYTVTAGFVTIGETNSSTGTCGSPVGIVSTVPGVALELSVNGGTYQAISGPATAGGTLPAPTPLNAISGSSVFTSAYANGVLGVTGVAGDVTIPSSAGGFSNPNPGCLVTGTI